MTTKPMGGFVVREKDGSGRVTALYSSDIQTRDADASLIRGKTPRHDWRHFLSHVFLPEGYPATVSDDYLQYQIWNSLQSFCSSLASLFASRAVLQGHGIGDASASATNAILLTILQDVFSRLTTIIAGYFLGTSLSPEAKMYRLLADILFDAALITDTLSPHLASISLSIHYPFLVPSSDSSLRVAALCLSGAFRALCGAVAGGSKAALTVHFATAGSRQGDIGDLSAKDGSKETVLALLGMLCGSVLVRYVHSTQMTYAVLLVLIGGHIATNYMAVRVVSMRVLNRQRASVVWQAYRSAFDDDGGVLEQESKATVLSAAAVSARERIFADPSCIPSDRGPSAHCSLGATFASIRQPSGTPTSLFPSIIPSLAAPSRPRKDALSTSETTALFAAFTNQKYLLWFASGPAPAPVPGMRLLVGLKEGHGPRDHLKAWAHAHEVVRRCRGRTPRGFGAQLAVVRGAAESVERVFGGFVEAAAAAGWKVDEGVLVAGSPVTMSVEFVEGGSENRKTV